MLEISFALFGLVLGSFGTVVAYRVPRKEGIATGRSRCPHCGRQIGAIENIPVLSYLWLRGRCAGCGARISPRYPLIELATGALFLSSALKFGFSGEAFVYAGLFWVLVVLTMIDLEHQLLPNRIVYPAFVVGVVALAAVSVVDGEFGRASGTLWFATGVDGLLLAILLWPAPEGATGDLPSEHEEVAAEATPEVSADPAHEKPEQAQPELPPIRWYEVLLLVALLGAWIALLVTSLQTGPYDRLSGAVMGIGVFGGLFFFLSLLYPAGMGGGDVKLTLLLGAMLGYLEAPGIVLAGMFMSFAAGGVVSIGLLAARRAGRKTGIPFGPFLAMGTTIAVLWGDSIVDYYASTL